MCDVTLQHNMCDLSFHVFIVVVDHMIVSFVGFCVAHCASVLEESTAYIQVAQVCLGSC